MLYKLYIIHILYKVIMINLINMLIIMTPMININVEAVSLHLLLYYS